MEALTQAATAYRCVRISRAAIVSVNVSDSVYRKTGARQELQATKAGVSMAERIYRMQAKLEEQSAPVTRMTSGGETPGLRVIRYV